jgi:hypothetical protein
MMNIRITQSKSGKAFLVTFHEGFSSYTITIPLSYAIQFFADGASTALETFTENEELLAQTQWREGEKEEIEMNLNKALLAYNQFLKNR